MKVNEDAEGVRALRDRAAALEEALRPFVHSARYSSGVDSHGARWCSPRVSVEEMDRARLLLGDANADSPHGLSEHRIGGDLARHGARRR